MPRSSFLTGMGTIFNIAGSSYSYNFSRTPQEADAKAIASDWKMVGQDLRSVIATFKKENEPQLRFDFMSSDKFQSSKA